MARTSFITTRSIYNGGDRGWRAGCRRKSVMFFVTCAKRSRISIAFTQWSKNGFFRPAGETHYLDKGEIWHGKAVRSPVPNFTFIGQNSGNTAPKTVKISNFGQKFIPQGRPVCNIFTKFSAFVRVYR